MWVQLGLKCADVGHLAAGWDVHERWVACLEEELFLQGDQERLMHVNVSPLMDRNKNGITKSQVDVVRAHGAGRACLRLKPCT